MDYVFVFWSTSFPGSSDPKFRVSKIGVVIHGDRQKAPAYKAELGLTRREGHGYCRWWSTPQTWNRNFWRGSNYQIHRVSWKKTCWNQTFCDIWWVFAVLTRPKKMTTQQQRSAQRTEAIVWKGPRKHSSSKVQDWPWSIFLGNQTHSVGLDFTPVLFSNRNNNILRHDIM